MINSPIRCFAWDQVPMFLHYWVFSVDQLFILTGHHCQLSRIKHPKRSLVMINMISLLHFILWKHFLMKMWLICINISSLTWVLISGLLCLSSVRTLWCWLRNVGEPHGYNLCPRVLHHNNMTNNVIHIWSLCEYRNVHCLMSTNNKMSTWH